VIRAAVAVIWINPDTKEVRVLPHAAGVPAEMRPTWCDPIGAAYSQWKEMNDAERVHLMLETALDLAMADYSLRDVLVAFAHVDEFRALEEVSHPMRRALAAALVGTS
jgi:hypothetical protein